MTDQAQFKVLENMLKRKFKNKDVSIAVGNEASNNTLIKGFINSGSLRLNLDLGGGYARGRIIEIYGPEGSSKSTLALTAVKNEQALGNMCAYIDAERALNKEYLEKIGVDFEKLLLIQTETAEQAWEAVEMIAQSGTVSLIVMDSIAALVPEDVLKKGISGDTMGRLAAANTQAITQVNPYLAKTNTSLLLINQVRQGLDMFGPKETTPGGNAIKFYCSQRIRLKRKEITMGDNGVPVSQTVAYQIVKNKVFSPGREGTFSLIYGEGIDSLKDIVDTALLVVTSGLELHGSWVKYEGESICQGRNNLYAWLADNPDAKLKIYANVMKGNLANETKSEEANSDSEDT